MMDRESLWIAGALVILVLIIASLATGLLLIVSTIDWHEIAHGLGSLAGSFRDGME